MKICLIALTQRRSCSFIDLNKYSDYSKYEYIDIARILHLGGAEVYSLDKRNPKKDKHFSFIKELDILDESLTDLNQFDALFLLNSNLDNIFGGYNSLGEDYHKKLKLVESFKGTIFFLFRDVNYLFSTDRKNKLASLNNKVYYISQSKNIDLLLDQIKKRVNRENTYTLIPKDIIYFPLEQSSIVCKDYLSEIDFNKEIVNYIPEYNENYQYDLMYIGGYRPKRLKYIKKYFAEGSNLFNTAILGASDKYKKEFEEYPNLTYLPSIHYYKLRNELNKSLATVAVGDSLNIKYDCITQRIYEAIDSKVVSFIDLELDPQKRAIDTNELKDFLYVNNLNDLQDRLLKLKNDENFRKNIINLQLNDPKYAINTKKYCENFVKILDSRTKTVV